MPLEELPSRVPDTITAILYGPTFGKAEAQAVLGYYQSIGDAASASPHLVGLSSGIDRHYAARPNPSHSRVRN